MILLSKIYHICQRSFFFNLKHSTTEEHRVAALSETRCRNWFRRIKDDDFDFDDRPREGRLKTFQEADGVGLYYKLLRTKTITGVWNSLSLIWHNTSGCTNQWFFSIQILGLTLSNPLKSLPWNKTSDNRTTQYLSSDNQPFRKYDDINKLIESWIS